jgi:hypothetical protein
VVQERDIYTGYQKWVPSIEKALKPKDFKASLLASGALFDTMDGKPRSVNGYLKDE